jgi:proton-dependent oligopeptide transporter, POT family
MVMNIGIFIGSMSAGFLAQSVSYHASFILGAFVSLLMLIIFLVSIPKFEFAKGRDIDKNLPFKPHFGTGLFIAIIVVLTWLFGWLLEHSNLTNHLMIMFVSAVSITLLVYAVKQPKEVRNKIFAFFVLAFIAMGFYICASLEPSLITLFVDSNVQLNLFGGHIPASNIYGMEPLFVVLLAYPIAKMWILLSKMKKEPSIPGKFSLALMVMGSGFLILSLSALMNTENQLINIGWVVVSYILLSSAEVMLMPVGNAMVGRLAPKKLEGLFMGTWQSFHGVSAAIAGVMIALVVLPKAHAPIEISNPVYEHSFFGIGIATVSAGVIALLLVPLINKILNAKSK